MSELLRSLAGGADRFVVVDTETTGVYPTDRIVEVAIVTMDLDGNVVEVWDTLVNPLRDVSASHIHGITATMVQGAPTFEAISGDVALRLHGACFVAHNIPFDTRMLMNEFRRVGEELVVVRGIDTYVESGCRLSQACSIFDIDLTGAHRARTDAWATSQLFLQLVSTCDRGAPIAAPLGLPRAGWVLRREDLAPARITEPPLITYLAAQIPLDGLEVRQQQYLELVARAIADLHLDVDERATLRTFADEYHLSEAQVAQAHRRYVNELVDAAIEDEQVTDDEYDSLVRVASALGVDQVSVEARIMSFRIEESLTVLKEGMEVVFTGGHPDYEREELLAYAASLGLVPSKGVSKTTGLVCAADAATTSGKATKARRYGIPVVSVDEFVRSRIGDVLAGSGEGQAGLKVVTCRDCLATWTVAATSSAYTFRRCDACAALAAKDQPSHKQRASRTATSDDPWGAPVIEWLTCRGCATVWHRQVTKGRKPHYCRECAGSSVPPVPV
jgi:DNA polymerase-3 subunit epsilon